MEYGTISDILGRGVTMTTKDYRESFDYERTWQLITTRVKWLAEQSLL